MHNRHWIRVPPGRGALDKIKQGTRDCVMLCGTFDRPLHDSTVHRDKSTTNQPPLDKLNLVNVEV
ncbi:hypothetical protein CTA1_6559 [Colletotrichum tanaceti]|uniref:Uncharacterized protein n=1 Tax=Colletotrichum tanaceti TaxID=1306861 RepID=A0A4U6X039_9PEZI|nr:hypothetical protein CTA1_6559 [Colletotrichum tanaceti]